MPFEQKAERNKVAAPSNEAQDSESLFCKISREFNVVTGGIIDGYSKGVDDAKAHPLRFAGNLAAAAGTTLALEGPGFVRVGASIIAAAGITGFAKQAADSYLGCLPAIKDTWQSANHIEDNKRVVAQQLGPLAFDVSLMPLAGFLGARVGQKLLRQDLIPISPEVQKVISPLENFSTMRIGLNGGDRLILLPDGLARYESVNGSVETYVHRLIDNDYLMFSRATGNPSEILPTIQYVYLKRSLLDRWIAKPKANFQSRVIRAMGEALEESSSTSLLNDIPTGSLPIGFGHERLAWITPDGSVAVIGPVQTRANCPQLLQPFKTSIRGTEQIEWFPYAESRDITYAEVKDVARQMEKSGWAASDWKPSNCGRLADGTVVRLDPEGVLPPSEAQWVMQGS